MASRQTRSVVWADDDCKRSLRALGRILGRRGLDVQMFEDYPSAHDHLTNFSTGLDRVSLLADVILPQSDRGDALDPYLGLKLAREASEMGIGVVCFLTVIRESEIASTLTTLREKHPKTRFEHIDKLELMSPNKLSLLIDYLNGGKPEGET